MFANAANLVARWLGLALLLGLVLPALAQRPIEFSTPVEEDTNAPQSFAPTVSHKAPNAFNAPKPLFGNDVSAGFDPLPRSPVSRNNNSQRRKSQDDDRNWALSTPQEILGVPTPESILGIDHTQGEGELTPAERFLKRQNHEQLESSATNGWHQDVGAQRKKGLWEPLNGTDDSRFDRAANGALVPGGDGHRNLQVLGQDAGTPAGQIQRNTVWDSAFASATPPPAKLTPEQIQSKQTFLNLLIPPDKSPAVPSGTPTVRPVAAHDPNFQTQPAYSRAGSVKALQADLAKPTGLTPLMGVSGAAPVPAKRAPLVKPPPWMSDQTADSTPAQRRF